MMAERRLGQRRLEQRSKRDSERWIKQFEKHRRLHRAIRKAGEDILQSKNFRKTESYIQHGNMTVNAHCRNVAKYSLVISEKLHIRCQKEELIRGALLHDYFLYDWHDKEHRQPYKLHGFFHPGIALCNAEKEYELTSREKDIIKKHMWPLTIVPPMYREAWIVSLADKWCSLMETFHLHKGHGAVQIEMYDREDMAKEEVHN